MPKIQDQDATPDQQSLKSNGNRQHTDAKSGGAQRGGPDLKKAQDRQPPDALPDMDPEAEPASEPTEIRRPSEQP